MFRLEYDTPVFSTGKYLGEGGFIDTDSDPSFPVSFPLDKIVFIDLPAIANLL